MRVVHVSDVYLPRLGGIETHVAGLAAAQRRTGLDAAVVTTTPAGHEPVAAAVTRLDAHGLLTPLRTANAVATAVRSITTGADVVAHVHLSLVSPFAMAVLRALALAHIPTVVTMHSVWDGVAALPPFLVRPVGADRWPVVWTAVSRVAADSAARVLGGRTPVQVLANGVDDHPWSTVARQRRPRTEGPLRLVSVMRLASRKRPLPLVDLLGDVLRLGVDVRAVLVGDGPQSRALQRRIDQHGDTDRIQLVGRLDRDGVRAALEQADVYLCPSVLESFGIAALEARCTGLPVVARLGSGVADFVTTGRDGLLVGSDEAMAATVAGLAVDRERLAAMTRRASSHLPPFTWADVLPRTERTYAEAAELVRPGAMPATTGGGGPYPGRGVANR